MVNNDLRTSAAHVFVAPEALDGHGTVALSGDTEHHLSRVLRLRDGEGVSLTDGAGRWRMSVATAAHGQLRLEATSEVVVEQRRYDKLTLATAIPKGDRLDWMVQKCTELGVDEIQLLHAERSAVRWTPDKIVKQFERLQRISDEAARQSRRVWRVELHSPLDASEVLPSAVVAEPGGRPIAPSDTMIAIGPEGGWTMAETDGAQDRVTLGPNILRTETAAVAAITLSVALSGSFLDSKGFSNKVEPPSVLSREGSRPNVKKS
jgi:16S rRNA (uracil1498-N3)-methyltransferase